MARPLPKGVQDFLNNFQKDLDALQKSLIKEKEGLVEKVKQVAQSPQVTKNRAKVEQLIETGIKKYEPTLQKFVEGIHSKALKAGVDMTELERRVKENITAKKEKWFKESQNPTPTLERTEKVETKPKTPKQARGKKTTDHENMSTQHS